MSWISWDSMNNPWDDDDTTYEDENGASWCRVCGCLSHNCECTFCEYCGEQYHVMDRHDCENEQEG